MSVLRIDSYEIDATAPTVETEEEGLRVRLAKGREICVPFAWFLRLMNATPEQRADCRLIGSEVGVGWRDVDEHTPIVGLLRGH